MKLMVTPYCNTAQLIEQIMDDIDERMLGSGDPGLDEFSAEEIDALRLCQVCVKETFTYHGLRFPKGATGRVQYGLSLESRDLARFAKESRLLGEEIPFFREWYLTSVSILWDEPIRAAPYMAQLRHLGLPFFSENFAAYDTGLSRPVFRRFLEVCLH